MRRKYGITAASNRALVSSLRCPAYHEARRLQEVVFDYLLPRSFLLKGEFLTPASGLLVGRWRCSTARVATSLAYVRLLQYLESVSGLTGRADLFPTGALRFISAVPRKLLSRKRDFLSFLQVAGGGLLTFSAFWGYRYVISNVNLGEGARRASSSRHLGNLSVQTCVSDFSSILFAGVGFLELSGFSFVYSVSAPSLRHSPVSAVPKLLRGDNKGYIDFYGSVFRL